MTDHLPPLPSTDALMQAAFDYGAACHMSGRDKQGVPRQGSYAIQHATEELLRAFGQRCYEAGVKAERERITEEVEDLRTNDRTVNLTAGEIVRNEIAEDLLAAIRG